MLFNMNLFWMGHKSSIVDVGNKCLVLDYNMLEKVPQEAAKHFEAQYFELARRYEDFAVWAYLHELKETKALIGSLSEYVQKQAALAKDSKTAIDIGLVKMHEAVISIPETLKISRAVEIADGLKRHYDKKIDEPIAEEEKSQGDRPRLHFPKIGAAFIPQSFKVLQWTSEVKSLEDEATWIDWERREDLGAFLLSYLSSPYSTDGPLVILGHPGSGKSLLTKVLSAQLMSEHYTIIRIPLREVDADASIMRQIEERIHRITGYDMNWATFSSSFKNCPPLVILDGYDELLQASGKVFSGYLKDVQDFQNNETVQGRPLRAIVTSRITLIDKADIPQGATIIRLLEFNRQQCDRWISIWNQENVSYFKEAEIDEFALPKDSDEESSKILSLAEQPLLLLMLALYDSEDNQLRKSKALDRTILYDSLLRRFIEREKMKDQEFKGLEPPKKMKELDLEMQRLAVAALGMYNRRKLHILSSELNEDIKFFGLERPVLASDGRLMTQAELLLGRFFFVHKSTAQVKAGASEYHEETAAFEFLHNTFGEFLSADFIIRQAIAEVASLKRLQDDEDSHLDLEKRLSDADGPSRLWFASLVYTPLFTRPVVLEMMREWIDHALNRKQMPKQEFLSNIDIIFLNQIKRLLSKGEMPSMIRGEIAVEGYRIPFSSHPLLGHIAIYSINLILMRIAVADKPFYFDENQIGIYEDGARPWDRLIHIWRSWFSLDNLNGIAAVMLSERLESQIKVQAKEKFQITDSQNRLETCLRVAISLGDNISSGLIGLLLYEPSKHNQLAIDDLAKRLESERLDMKFHIAMERLKNRPRISSKKAPEFAQEIEQALEMAFKYNKKEDLEYIALSLHHMMAQLRRGKTRNDFLRKAIHPRMAVEALRLNPEAAFMFFKMAKEVNDFEWIEYFIGRAFDMFVDLRYLAKLNMLNPEIALALTQELLNVGGYHYMRHFDFDHVIEPHYLARLIELNPELALTWVQITKNFEGGRLLQRLDSEFLKQKLDLHNLLEMSNESPKTALVWVQLIKELGMKHLLQDSGQMLFEHVLDIRYLRAISNRDPNMALTWVQLASEFVDDNLIRNLDFEQMLDPNEILLLCRRSPKAALVYMQIIHKAGAESFFKRPDETIDKWFKKLEFDRILQQEPTALAVLLRLARITKSPYACEQVLKFLTSSLHQPSKNRGSLETLPLSTLSDLQWIAKSADNPEISSFLNSILDENRLA